MRAGDLRDETLVCEYCGEVHACNCPECDETCPNLRGPQPPEEDDILFQDDDPENPPEFAEMQPLDFHVDEDLELPMDVDPDPDSAMDDQDYILEHLGEYVEDDQ